MPGSGSDEDEIEEEPFCRHWAEVPCIIDCVECLHPCSCHPFDGGEYCLVAGCDCEQFKDTEN